MKGPFLHSGILVAAAAMMLAACATPPSADTARQPAPKAQPPGTVGTAPVDRDGPLTLAALAADARIVDTDPALQCVTYARAQSGIQLYGDAGTWWAAARGRYERSHAPREGAVLVLRPTRTSRGHLAVVTQVIANRLIVADHANWLNNGRIHKGTPIEDVSAAGDWSLVRVWYTPGGVWGRSKYAANGFILAEPPRVAQRPAT